MDQPTPAERAAFLWMQGRMIELLQRHDVDRFSRLFTERTADPSDLPEAIQTLLQRQRDLAVFFYLRDDLFDNILPRIKRRLSFVAPRLLQREELPARGRIDWGRTAAAGLRERPGSAPLTVHTRRRRRHFATPENLLTVATLLEYREAAQALLDAELAADSVAAVRHPLHEIVEGSTRELVFPQFAGLVAQAQAILTGQGSTLVEDLESAVGDGLQPGSNSAYHDLLAWRQRLYSLRLLDRTADSVLQPMIGADPQRDNYLYQFWLFYELAALLEQRGCLRDWDTAKMVLTYTWGTGPAERAYRLQHDQAIPGIPAYWKGGPGVRPDFYISRPDRQEVRDSHGTALWHEPGYVLDAKYYRPSDSSKAPSSPIKRMIADLELTGEQHGKLLFAFHGPATDDSTDAADDTTEPATPLAGRIQPHPDRAQRVAPDLRITIKQILPGFVAEGTHDTLVTELLEAAHVALRPHIPIRCHAIFLDSLTATAHGTLADAASLQQRNGHKLSAPPPGETALDDLVVCPKPHIGPWRVDLVSRTHDCCQNAALCHILSVPGLAIHKPERLTLLDAVTAAIEETAGGDIDPDVSAQRAAQYVRTIGKRYVKLLQQDLGHYQLWIQRELEMGDDFQTTPLLTNDQRETLALARFLWEQIDQIGANNFAAPVLLFTGVLEEITQATIYRVQQPPLSDEWGKALQQTLGVLGNSKGYGGANWRLLDHTINGGGYWNAHLDEGLILPFEKWINTVQSIVKTRNQAAHHAHVERTQCDKLLLALFGSTRTGMGLLNGILMAWRNPPAPPKTTELS